VAILVAWLAFNAVVFAPNGRYLFQASAAIGPLLATGILTLFGRRGLVSWIVTVALAALALATPVGILAPLFNAPPARPLDEVAVAQPLEAVFDNRVRLVGYDLAADEVHAGQGLDVTLYLTAARPITESLALGLQMKSAAPRDDTVLVNFRNWPGGGNLPTTAWVPGEVFADRYLLKVPSDVEHLQDWELRLMFFEHPSQEGGDDRLPVLIGGIEGGPYVVLGHVRVEPAKQSAVPAHALLGRAPVFGAGREIVLEGATVEVDESPAMLQVTLWWRAVEPLGADYTVFVHLLDEHGVLVASGDGPPREGAMPTSRWQEGDLVVDEHTIALPTQLPQGPYVLAAGFYNDEGRLPAWDARGDAIAGGSAQITVWRNGGT
jgi:hypothetical protein